MAYFMARHGKHAWWVTAAVALGLPAVLFMMFEVWFKTPLPKGPLEALLGLN
jgi:putative tricarboxylic transport membrane protein